MREGGEGEEGGGRGEEGGGEGMRREGVREGPGGGVRTPFIDVRIH